MEKIILDVAKIHFMGAVCLEALFFSRLRMPNPFFFSTGSVTTFLSMNSFTVIYFGFLGNLFRSTLRMGLSLDFHQSI